MRVLLFLLGLGLLFAADGVRVWNGSNAFLPGTTEAVNFFRGDTDLEEIEAVEPFEEEEEEVEEPIRSSFEVAMKQIMAFKNKEGYFRAGNEEEYTNLIVALSRFRVSGGAQAALDAARGNKHLPLFFSITLGEEIEEEPIRKVVGTATVTGCKSREESYPLSKEAAWFTIGSNPLATTGELETPSYGTMREFVERELVPIVGSANKDAILDAARKGFESDLKFFGIRSTPGLMSVKVWNRYAGNTEEHIPAVRFLPFMERRGISTHPTHADARRELAEALDLDPERLEEEIEKIAAEKNIRRAIISYWPHLEKLRVEAPSARMDVDVRPLTPEMLWREAERYGSMVGTSFPVSIDDLEIIILDQLGMYEDVNGNRVYKHHLFPEQFVRLTQESKSGVEGKIVSYRFTLELSPRPILSAAQLQAAIQRVLDQDPKQTHFQYGCVQTRENIMEIFSQYQKGFANPSDAFPCRLGYDYTTRSVVMFQKEEDPNKPLASYGLGDLKSKSIKELKEVIYENHGLLIPADAEEYKALVAGAIEAKGLPVKLEGEKVSKGYYIQVDVFKDTIVLDVLPKG